MNTISWLGGPFSEKKQKNKNENKCKEKQQVNKDMKKIVNLGFFGGTRHVNCLGWLMC